MKPFSLKKKIICSLFPLSQALAPIPEVVLKSNPSLQSLQKEFEALYNDGKGMQKEITAVLKSDNVNANQSL